MRRVSRKITPLGLLSFLVGNWPGARPGQCGIQVGVRREVRSTLGLGETCQQFVGFFLDRGESILCRGFAGDDTRIFADHHVADLDVEAQTVAAGVLTGRELKLLDAHFGGRELFVVTLLGCQFVGFRGDRNIAGFNVPEDLVLGRCEVIEEGGRCGVLFIALAGHREQGRAADEGLCRLGGHALPVRQEGCAEVEVHTVGNATEGTGRADPHRDFPRLEGVLVVPPTRAVPVVVARLFPLRERGEVVHDGGMVHQQFDIGTAVAVVIGGEGQVVAREEVLGHGPLQKRRAHPGITGVQQRGRDLFEVFIGLRRLDTGFGQRVGIVVENRRGGVERHTDHHAIGVRVEVAHARDEFFTVELIAVVGHQRLDRDRGALRCNHRGGACIEDLHDIGLLTRAERGNRRGQRLFIRPLEDRRDDILVLACVEVLGHLVDRFAQLAAHGVPPFDFGLRLSGASHQAECKARAYGILELHWSLPS
mmetsp:Transcript_880/g.1675  ORF Transcript_880/g.1675 Transcript_880/m.1675 type:complete len:479 (-) Transcript_880:415-1851(-)